MLLRRVVARSVHVLKDLGDELVYRYLEYLVLIVEDQPESLREAFSDPGFLLDWVITTSRAVCIPPQHEDSLQRRWCFAPLDRLPPAAGRQGENGSEHPADVSVRVLE